jgi:MSHA biogenesis protein MshK
MRRRFRILMLCLAPLCLAAAASAQTFRDPMRPPGSAPVNAGPARATAFRLEGVIAGAVRVAIVNGRLVRAGDDVAGAHIIEVLVDGVRYSRAGHVQTLVLPGVHPLMGVRVARSPEATKP